MKIGTTLKVVVAVLLTFSLISLISTYVQLSAMSDDGRVVNYAGIIRGATQRLVKLELGDKPSDELMTRIDKIIVGIVQGSAELGLPKAQNADFVVKMKDVSDAWSSLRQNILKARSDRSLNTALLKESEDYFELTNKAVAAAESSAKGKVTTQKAAQLAIFVLNVFLLGYILFSFRTKIIIPLATLNGRFQKMATGDLSVRTGIKSLDEIGEVCISADAMANTMSTMVGNIVASSNSVASTVDQLQHSAERTAKGARDQSGQATQIATAAEEMSQTITEISRNSAVASDTSTTARDLAQNGQNAALEAVEAVNRVYMATIELATTIEKLNTRTHEIGDIVTVITDIADQTNLLALNAAIEAARAGEQGRGFAVVADEVRKLAERTIKATKEITVKIKAVQEDATSTMESMQQASSEVTKANDFIHSVGESLGSIVDAVQRVGDQITQIAAAVEEQSAVSDDVARNIERTSAIATEMERMSDNVMNEVNSLIAVAHQLAGAAGTIKVR